MTRVLIVIVNYRTPGLTIDCLRSLDAEVARLEGVRVVVTDNLSGDDSVAQLNDAVARHGWASWCEIRPLPRNGGFAYGNNEGTRDALQLPGLRYVLLLNPDTIVRPGAVAELLAFMDGRPDVGIAGSRLEEPDGTPQRSAFRFATAWSELEEGLRLGLASRVLDRYIVAPPVSDEPCPTDWVAGASMMIRREVLDAIGLLDEGYFMYYEEVDFCLRAKRAGWPCWYVPASHVVHLVGQASGVTDTKKPRKRRPAYWFESRRRFFVKNRGRAYAMLADAAWIAGFSAWRVRRQLQRKPDTDPPQLLGDSIRHSTFMRGFGGAA